jgi:hypothetical protein
LDGLIKALYRKAPIMKQFTVFALTVSGTSVKVGKEIGGFDYVVDGATSAGFRSVGVDPTNLTRVGAPDVVGMKFSLIDKHTKQPVFALRQNH